MVRATKSWSLVVTMTCDTVWVWVSGRPGTEFVILSPTLTWSIGLAAPLAMSTGVVPEKLCLVGHGVDWDSLPARGFSAILPALLASSTADSADSVAARASPRLL